MRLLLPALLLTSLVSSPAYALGSFGYDVPTLTWPSAPDLPTQNCTATAPVSPDVAFACPVEE